MSDPAYARHLIDTAERWFETAQNPAVAGSTKDEYYSIAVTLELALKAWLTLHGYTSDQLRMNIGHDLGKAALLTAALGLPLPSAMRPVLPMIHPFFMQGGFHRPNTREWPEALLTEARLPLTHFYASISAAVACAEAANEPQPEGNHHDERRDTPRAAIFAALHRAYRAYRKRRA